jgi:hypothetical protein
MSEPSYTFVGRADFLPSLLRVVTITFERPSDVTAWYEVTLLTLLTCLLHRLLLCCLNIIPLLHPFFIVPLSVSVTRAS